jgi:hypothetical protein
MASRPNFSPYIVIPNANAQPANTGSMASSIISAPTVISNLSLVSYGFSWTGTAPIGTVSVQVSNDFSLNPDGSVLNPGTWNSVTLLYQGALVTSIPITGNTGNGLIDVTPTAAFASRAVYTAGSGTGTLQVIINGKVS